MPLPPVVDDERRDCPDSAPTLQPLVKPGVSTFVDFPDLKPLIEHGKRASGLQIGVNDFARSAPISAHDVERRAVVPWACWRVNEYRSEQSGQRLAAGQVHFGDSPNEKRRSGA